MPKTEMTTGQKVRRVIAPAGIGTAAYGLEKVVRADGTFDLLQFLLWLGTSAGGGIATYWTIEYGEKVTKRTWPGGWNSDFKFYFAQALSYVYPVSAYLGTVWAGWQEWSVSLLVAAVLVGYQIAGAIHQETKPPPEPEQEGP
jgi:hypothetical protein